jgi:hypothetical protein
VSTIAGIHLGSSIVNRLNWLHLSGCFLNLSVQKEFPYQSEKAKELLASVREPLQDGVAARSYEFYASPEDLIVPNLDSSLPYLGKGEVHRIIPGHGHCSLFGAVAEEQIASCVDWINQKGNK